MPVKMLKQGKRYSIEHLRATMLKFIEDNDIQRAVKKGGFGDFVEYGEKLDRNEAREAVMNGKEWHNNMLKLVASWVTKGNTDAEIHGLAKELILDGYSEEDTRVEVQAMIDGARSKGFCPPEIEPTAEQESAAAGDDDGNGQQTSNATVIEGQTIPYWNNKLFRWNGVALSRAYTDDDGAVSWKPFAKALYTQSIVLKTAKAHGLFIGEPKRKTVVGESSLCQHLSWLSLHKCLRLFQATKYF